MNNGEGAKEARLVRPEDIDAPPRPLDEGRRQCATRATAEIGATALKPPAVQEDSSGAIEGMIVSAVSPKESTSSGSVESKSARLNRRRQG